MKTIAVPHDAFVEQNLNKEIARQSTGPIRAKDIILACQARGIQCYVTGGTPRDWLQHQMSTDIDLSLACSIEDAARLLKEEYPTVDPTLFFDENFGLIAWGESSANHIDINILRDVHDVTSSCYVPRSEIGSDYLTRDFSINSLYYDPITNIILDPTCVALDDLNAKRLRLISAPIVVENYRTISFRIVKFLIKGYIPDASCDIYLKNYLARDLREYSHWEFDAFLEHHLVAKGCKLDLYLDTLRSLAKLYQCEDVFLTRIEESSYMKS